MTEYELHDLIYEVISMAENNFEFWLTGSFAVLVAGYYTFSNLTVGLRRRLLILYGLISLVFLTRWIDAAFIIGEYYTDLEEQGLPGYPYTIGTGIAYLFQTGLMIFGTIAVISFLLARGGENARKIE